MYTTRDKVYAKRQWTTVWHEGKNRNNKVIYTVTASIHQLGEQSPYFAVTYDESDNYSRRRGDIRACGAGGYDMVRTIKRQRDTLLLARCEHFWHLFSVTTGGMHYVANGLFWRDITLGVKPCGQFDTPETARDHFYDTIKYGALEMDSRYQPLDMPRETLKKWLEARRGALMVAFRRDMVALFPGLTFDRVTGYPVQLDS